MRVSLLVVLVSVAACGGGGGNGSGADAATAGVFTAKAGNWTGDDGCQEGRLLLLVDGPTVTAYLGDLSSQIFISSFMPDTSNADVLHFNGSYIINGSDASWSCSLTCDGASSLTLACTNANDASKNCSEAFAR